MLCRLGTVTWNERKQPVKVEKDFNLWAPARDEAYTVESDFQV